RATVTGHLEQPTRGLGRAVLYRFLGSGSVEPEPRKRRARLRGLAPDGVCRAVSVTGDAVGSYPAVSPLPGGPKPARRFVLCRPSLGVPATGRYPASRSLELGLSSRPGAASKGSTATGDRLYGIDGRSMGPLAPSRKSALSTDGAG